MYVDALTLVWFLGTALLVAALLMLLVQRPEGRPDSQRAATRRAGEAGRQRDEVGTPATARPGG